MAKILWPISLKSIPELSDLAWRQRYELWRRCSIKGFYHWQSWVALILCFAWSILITWLRYYMINRYPFFNKMWFNLSITAIGGIFGIYLFFVCLTVIVRPCLKQEREKIGRP